MFLRKPVPSRAVPQSQLLDPRQVRNEAGGHGYTVDRWELLHRFLTVGMQGGTYYVGEQKLTDRATELVLACVVEDGPRAVQSAVEVSLAGRALKQDYTLYVLALALASPDLATRAQGYRALPLVCRTGSTLFQLLSYVKGRRGWSRGLRRAVAAWYDEMDEDKLAYQLVKYRNRQGFTHRDAMRLAHPCASGDARQTLYAWAVGKESAAAPLPQVVRDFDAAGEAQSPDVELAKRLPREALPAAWLNDASIMEALLYGTSDDEDGGRGMPLTALLRNLGNLSKCGLLVANSKAASYVVEELSDGARIRAARVHPIAIFLAGRMYASGAAIRGSGTWAPVGSVVEALDHAFQLAFANVEPSHRRILVAVDASASMSTGVLGLPVSARDAALAMALVTAKTEPNARLVGFTDANSAFELKVARDERLRDVAARFAANVEGRATDCAEPLRFAAEAKFDLDALVIYTDSETWAGSVHPQAALEATRKRLRHRVKSIVAATTATSHSIGDPGDRDVLQVSGFDASVPAVIANFLRT